jgi:hypothetical protein
LGYVLQALCYSFAIVGASLAFTSFLKRRSDNMTYVDRIKADIDAKKSRMDMDKEILKLMEGDTYTGYLEGRAKTFNQLVSDGFISYNLDTEEARRRLDSIAGRLPFSDF